MPLFSHKHDKVDHTTKSQEAGAGYDPEHRVEYELEHDRLHRQLHEERQQRLEDVRKERAERLASQEEQRRLLKENTLLTRKAEDLRLRLEAERERARRKGLFGALFANKNEEPSNDR